VNHFLLNNLNFFSSLGHLLRKDIVGVEFDIWIVYLGICKN